MEISHHPEDEASLSQEAYLLGIKSFETFKNDDEEHMGARSAVERAKQQLEAAELQLELSQEGLEDADDRAYEAYLDYLALNRMKLLREKQQKINLDVSADEISSKIEALDEYEAKQQSS